MFHKSVWKNIILLPDQNIEGFFFIKKTKRYILLENGEYFIGKWKMKY